MWSRNAEGQIAGCHRIDLHLLGRDPGKEAGVAAECRQRQRFLVRQANGPLAMAGVDQKAMFGDESAAQQRQPRRGDASHKQKGKVLRVHNGDVFIEMPGGRSQGVMPTTQFPDGLPQVGDPVDEAGRVVLEAERLLLREWPAAVVLRFAGIYGPGRLLRHQALLAGEPLAGVNDVHFHPVEPLAVRFTVAKAF